MEEKTIEMEVGYKKGSRLYPGQTENGFCYKDRDAFDKKDGSICYIPEGTFDELSQIDEEEYIPLDEASFDWDRYKAKDPMYEGICVYSYKDIQEMVEKECEECDIDVNENREFVEYVIEDIFNEIDWQSPSSYFYGGYDLEEQYQDWLED